MKKLLYFLALGFIIVFASCSSYKYNTTRVQDLDFSQYKTYGWLPPIDSLSKNYYNNDIAKSNIMSTANKEIEARGLTYSKENPDILFRYVTIVNNKSRLVYGSSYWGMGWGWGWGGPWGFYRPWGLYGGYSYPVGKERYRYSHLIIEAIDRKTNTVVWQARGSNEIDNPETAINKLPKVVSGIMKQYPLQLKK
ncbi:DUF4136 domain-containing protein [Sphingobacterium spiritivorum]|uniref:DUF4136 domain-containing protein n=1 Tax=Sphingobacterium spiritivorum ATCC 33861 TaxID=525373 RepID=D7VJK4_SPHSI|nr:MULTISPECIES: DUF4136 domain-containing protein [Sphingobacterium]EFK59057.1 hypothetical protein HMPREF0766_11173 [Sphingobacterium spiritivorum ATCC 33861]QQS94088.1 DUF4136 domain-containing protein [Sphingobacterium spiritivorum]QQT27161.1 DUF4136 domain-containing protein [Sphingobacterium spiritivorum]QQT36916.1 DUF4136 domain-containing protein [Sphingobacterium spiritivorum]WQD33677.1 DUF4136 domain-containing protein [Sphingobacterium spiritivorum]